MRKILLFKHTFARNFFIISAFILHHIQQINIINRFYIILLSRSNIPRTKILIFYIKLLNFLISLHLYNRWAPIQFILLSMAKSLQILIKITRLNNISKATYFILLVIICNFNIWNIQLFLLFFISRNFTVFINIIFLVVYYKLSFFIEFYWLG